jgi:hypothetical protein
MKKYINQSKSHTVYLNHQAQAMRVKTRNKYLRIMIWISIWVIAFLIFDNRYFSPFRNLLLSLNYFGTFIAGALFSYSFSAVPAAAILLILGHEQNLYLAGFIGSLGALTSDIFIFKFSRLFFKKRDIKKNDTLGTLQKINVITKFLITHFSVSFLKYLKITVAAIIIASPLPNEIGIAMLASTLNLSINSFIFISLILNLIGVFILLGLGRLF